MSKKKDPVLWVVVDKDGHPWTFREWEPSDCSRMDRAFGRHAPFRVVKYVTAPKKRKKA